MRSVAVSLAVVVATAIVGGCGHESDSQTSAPDYAKDVSSRISIDATMAHLQRLQDIADANGGNRAAGTPGFEQSVQYVADTLRDKGFDVSTPAFELNLFRPVRASLTVGGKPIQAAVMQYSQPSAPQGATGPMVVAPASDAPGCAPESYGGLPVKGSVVLVDRGTCYVAEKAQIAAELGAVALVVADNVDEAEFGGAGSANDDTKIPVVTVTKAVGAALRSAPADATVVVDAHVDKVTTHNVVAQTKTGSTDNVVMVGGHLDSVEKGPGINDNGTGVAAILETAVQMGASPPVTNAVRFAFWSAEELGLIGSENYVRSLDEQGLRNIAMYLNFDMLGSPNACYFTSDADQSTKPDFDSGLQLIPEGAPGIERTLVSALESNGVTPEDMAFDGRSDYDSFTRAGVPSGNMDTGAEEDKTPAQAKEWGGEAEKPCDPNYHEPGDTVGNVNKGAFDKMGRVVGYATALYAQDLTGRNGVPERQDRTRHVLEPQ